MSQAPGRPCPACGTPVPAGQRFCSNCGTDLSVSGPASQYGGSSPQQMPPYGQPQQQVPPYAQAPGAFNQQPLQPYQQQNQQRSNPIAEALGALGLLFFMRRYRPGYRPRRQSSGCCGCLVLLVILLLVVGIPAYAYYRVHPNVVSQLKSQIQNSNNNVVDNGNGNGTTATPVTRAPVTINQSVVYAGVNINIESVQQASIFTDDNNIPSDTNGMVRVKFKETNNSGQNAGYYYPDVMHLILPDKSTVALANVQQSGPPQNGTTRENWVDFVVPMSDKIDQMTLVLGTSQEAQMSIPLTGKADLSAYQAKTATLNKPISYDTLNWTLLSATESFSIPDKQATSGMRYVVLSFKVDNPTSNDKVIGFPEDYMRLKAGGITSSQSDRNIPLYAKANTTGTTGTVTFLMPQGNTAYTLIFLAAQNYSTVQVNTDFTI